MSIYALGVDQGIANCGYGIVVLGDDDSIIVLESGTLITKADKDLPERLDYIFTELEKLAIKYPINIIGCEKLFFNPNGNKENKKRNKSASIVYTNMASALVFLLGAKVDTVVKDFVPGTIKKYITGNGNASKDEVKEGIKLYLDKSMNVKTEHQSDGIAIAITSAKYYKDNESIILNPEPKKSKGNDKIVTYIPIKYRKELLFHAA